MKFLVLIIALCFFSFNNGLGQVKFNTNKFQTGSLASQLKTGENQYENVKGSPYAKFNFQSGYVAPKEGYIVEDLKLRFNIYADQFEILGTDSVIYSLTPFIGVHFVGVFNSKYIYHPYYSQKKLQNGYFRIAVEGQACLLVKERKTFHFEEEAKAYIAAKPARFVEVPNDYYILKEAQLPIKFDTVGELTKALVDKNQEIKGFVKKEKIRKSNLENFVKIVEYFNSLK